MADKIQQKERCDLNTKLPNRYFNPNHKHLQRFTKMYINDQKRSH